MPPLAPCPCGSSNCTPNIYELEDTLEEVWYIQSSCGFRGPLKPDPGNAVGAWNNRGHTYLPVEPNIKEKYSWGDCEVQTVNVGSGHKAHIRYGGDMLSFPLGDSEIVSHFMSKCYEDALNELETTVERSVRDLQISGGHGYIRLSVEWLNREVRIPMGLAPQVMEALSRLGRIPVPVQDG